MSLLGPRTSICNNVRRVGSSFPPRQCCQSGLLLGLARDIARSFVARSCEYPCPQLVSNASFCSLSLGPVMVVARVLPRFWMDDLTGGLHPPRTIDTALRCANRKPERRARMRIGQFGNFSASFRFRSILVNRSDIQTPHMALYHPSV
jgi:hypothetical protein